MRSGSVRLTSAVAGSGIIARRKAHLDELCLEHSIERVYLDTSGERAKANVGDGRVLISQTTGVRTYFVALHEIGHCVLGVDQTKPIAPQEAEAWRWALDNAREEPTRGVRRMIFKALWHYLLRDLDRADAAELRNRDLFPGPDDPYWSFLASLDEEGRLLYEAAKVTARAHPAEGPLPLEQLLEAERTKTRTALRRARVKIAAEEREVGPPKPAAAGDLVVLSKGGTAHILARDGYYGVVLATGDTLCGAGGVARPAPPDADTCWSCQEKA